MRSFRLFFRAAQLAPLAAVLSLAVGCGGNASPANDRDPSSTSTTSEALLAASRFAFVHIQSNTVDGSRSYTSGGGTNSVTHNGTGSYTVTFANVGINAGNVQVVAEGGDASRCRLVNWMQFGADEQVNVRCSAPTGADADSDFEAMFYVGQGTWASSQYADSAYAWFSPSGTMPSGSYNYNSKYAGATPNTVTIVAPGSYQVRLAGVHYQNASVLVTAYGGSGAPFCNIGGWSPAGSDTNVTVNCFDTLGHAATDVGFSLSYATTGPTLEQLGGHAWIYGGAMPPSYAMVVGPFLGCSGSLTQVGTNGILVDGLTPWHDPLVETAFTSAYSTSATYCKLASFTAGTTSGQAIVNCYNADGSAAPNNFTVTITSNTPSGPC